MKIVKAESQADWEAVRQLFREYADWLQTDLWFQGFEQELATLPGKYSEPAGCALLAWEGEVPVGVVALRPSAPGIAEMKRLFIRTEFQGGGRGRALAEAIIAEAKARGYSYLRLDTLARMEAAVALYRKLGFYNCAPYCDNPLSDAIYLEAKIK